MSGDLRALRKPYNGRNCLLLEDDLPSKDPIELFAIWFDEVKKNSDILEPNAMNLATCTKDGFPSSRFLLCKGFSKDGFQFFTHYTSRKGQELEENPNAALAFYWAKINRQVRIEGCVEKLPFSDADNYFYSRPYASQVGAACSNQSKPVMGRKELMDKEVELKNTYKEAPVPRPEKWGGYIVKPRSIEFWQGQSDRIHDRIKFFKPTDGEKADAKLIHEGEDGWLYQRLAP